MTSTQKDTGNQIPTGNRTKSSLSSCIFQPALQSNCHQRCCNLSWNEEQKEHCFHMSWSSSYPIHQVVCLYPGFLPIIPKKKKIKGNQQDIRTAKENKPHEPSHKIKTYYLECNNYLRHKYVHTYISKQKTV